MATRVCVCGGHRGLQILLVLSLVALIPCFYIFDWLDANGMRGGVGRMYGSWAALFSFPLVIVATQLRILFVKQYKRCVRQRGRRGGGGT